MELSEAKIAELKQKHGDRLFALDAPNGVTMVFHAPTKAVWTEFIDTTLKDKSSKVACILKCALQCVAYPSVAEVSAVFDQYPALPASINVELAKLAGQSDDLDIKKL